MNYETVIIICEIFGAQKKKMCQHFNNEVKRKGCKKFSIFFNLTFGKNNK